MSRLLALAAMLCLVPMAGAASVRSVTAPAPVLALELDGVRVAYATGRSARDCDRVFVWNLATRGVSKLGRKTHCERTSTGNQIAAVSIAGTRVLWLHYVGGNTRDWTVWTATTTRPTPVRLRFVSRDADATAPIVIGKGEDSRLGSLLPYAVDRVAVALRANGSRAFTWTAPARIVALAAGDGRLAVASEGGVVGVLDDRGRFVRTERFGGEIDAVRITGDLLVAQRGRTLELRGGRAATYSLAAGVKLADADGDRAVLVGGGKVRTLDLGSGRVAVAAAGSFAALEGATLAVASGRIVSAR
ncbi:MAG TPA: hypothetical protein VFV62_01655 [Gaiellaceae bacterium]|nr:hypothetical protein [Gaiellaceae bacterium]